ncbi:MAG: hypothetical protein IJ860_06165 [Eubacterium sp.]|nr:hypothetical protein [Eubacterium sp.]
MKQKEKQKWGSLAKVSLGIGITATAISIWGLIIARLADDPLSSAFGMGLISILAGIVLGIVTLILGIVILRRGKDTTSRAVMILVFGLVSVFSLPIFICIKIIIKFLLAVFM